MLALNSSRKCQLPCQRLARGMCDLIKLPQQRLQTKKSIAEIEEGLDENFDSHSSPLADIEARIEASKAKLLWRTPVAKNTSAWFSRLRFFAPQRTNVDRMVRFNRDKFSLKAFLEYRRQVQMAHECFMQSFIIERHKLLGNDLATAHFLVHRGGSVKFTNSDKWIKRNEMHEYTLPSRYNPEWILEELNCDNMVIHYEGFENIRRLNNLKKFSLQNVKTLDDWSLDRLAGNDFAQLEILNISGTNVTANGLIALQKLPSLRLLIVDNPKRSIAFELTLLAMQDTMPNLVVRDSVTDEEI